MAGWLKEKGNQIRVPLWLDGWVIMGMQTVMHRDGINRSKVIARAIEHYLESEGLKPEGIADRTEKVTSPSPSEP